MMQKRDTVIFVDIDGPLLPARMHYDKSNASFIFDHRQRWKNKFSVKRKVKFDPTMCYVLNKWIELSEAKIVLSTAWTKYTDFTEFEFIFGKNGIQFNTIHDDWRTEKNLNGQTRGDEIARWLEEHQDSVSNYLVLDDDSTVLNHPKIRPTQVLLIDFLNGISWRQIFQGCEILGIVDYDLLKMK